MTGHPMNLSSWGETLFFWFLILICLRRHVLVLLLFAAVRDLIFRFVIKQEAQGDPVCLAMADHIFRLTNEYRSKNGLKPLKRHKKLVQSSLYHARRMAVTGEFDHVLSDGVTIGGRVKRVGYAFTSVRENLYMHSDFLGATPRRMAKLMMKGWIASPGHKENLDAKDITQLGVAVVKSQEGFYAVQNFGRPLLQLPNQTCFQNQKPSKRRTKRIRYRTKSR